MLTEAGIIFQWYHKSIDLSLHPETQDIYPSVH